MSDYEKDFEKWNKKKQYLNARKKLFYFKERQIWWASLGVNIGCEIDGKNENFERPVLVLRRLGKYNAIVIPLTSTCKENAFYVPYDWQGVKKSAVISQVRMLDARRFQRKMGTMPQHYFEIISEHLEEILK